MNKAQRKLMRAVRKLRILRIREHSSDYIVGWIRPDEYVLLTSKGLVALSNFDDWRYKLALWDIAAGRMRSSYVYFKYNREFAEEWNLKLYR